MSEFAYIYIFFLLTFLCIAVAFLIHIRDKKDILIEDPDFVTEYLETKRKLLETNLPNLSFQLYLLLIALCPIIFGVLLWLLLPNKSISVIIAFFTIFLPDFIIQIVIERKKRKFEERYVRAIKSLAAALRSGMSIQQAVKDVTNNPFVDREIVAGFTQIDSDITVGISIEEAFLNYANKTDSEDARDVATAIALQTEVGGSEAKVIDSIARNIEERLLTKKEIRSSFAGTDFMIKAFDVLPVLALLLMVALMPTYMEPVLQSPLYLAGLILILLFSLYGSFKIRKIEKKAKGE